LSFSHFFSPYAICVNLVKQWGKKRAARFPHALAAPHIMQPKPTSSYKRYSTMFVPKVKCPFSF
jgi:hypothetical protein